MQHPGQGRISRRNFIKAALFTLVVIFAGLTLAVVFMAVTQGLSESISNIGFFVIFVGTSLAVTYIQYETAVRRLHDLDKSGWFVLLYFVPLVSFILWVYLLCAKGTAGPNRFGAPMGEASFTDALYNRRSAAVVSPPVAPVQL